MDKKSLYFIGGIIAVAVISLSFFSGDSLSLTSYTSARPTECVGPQTAMDLINNDGCIRIYENQNCLDQGKVEVQC